MPTQTVSMNLPQKTHDRIAAYCAEHSITPTKFMVDALSEYQGERLIEAVRYRIEHADLFDVDMVDIRRTSYRMPPEPPQKLREFAKRTHLTFDGLTRIILDDKLERLEQQRP